MVDMANLLVALKNIVLNPNNKLVLGQGGLNRANSMGEALEVYAKDIFSGGIALSNISAKEKLYSKTFSYIGNQNNPPDIIIRGGDAIEVKKHIGITPGSLALNSSYPKDILYADSPMITEGCRTCEEWERKDILYVVGSVDAENIRSLWFVYGDCYAASRDVYEKIRNVISAGVNALPDVEFGETKELGRVNRVDPLGITDLRIRGMWAIRHPARAFSYLPDTSVGGTFNVNAIMLTSKFESFPENDRKELEKLVEKNLLIKDVEIKSPNNPAKLLPAKYITFSI